jgi:hypothetical protein
MAEKSKDKPKPVPTVNVQAYRMIIEQTSLACIFAAVGSLLLIALLLPTISDIQLLMLIVAFFLAFMGIFGTHDAVKDLYFRQVTPRKGLLVSRLMMFSSFIVMLDSLMILVFEKILAISNILTDPFFLAINIVEVVVIIGIIAKVQFKDPQYK